ncbi:MAG: hypothetical protein R3242_11855 [Akkermansiaceae bacterium]|nr:hypothetical protein [Akkermansiaceae bacterium]
MHLRLSDQELATLIEMVSLAADVATWNRKEGSQPKAAAFEELEAKLLAKAAHSGLGELLEFSEEEQRYRLRQDLPQPFFYQECYDEFRNESFWDELAIRLADRDLARAIGLKQWEALSEEQRRERTKDIEKRYWDEFTKRGVERIIMLHPPEEG